MLLLFGERGTSHQMASAVLWMTADDHQYTPQAVQAEQDGCEPVVWHLNILAVIDADRQKGGRER